MSGPKQTKAGISPLAVIILTVVLDLIGFGIIVPLLSRYAEDFGANGFMIGLLFLSYAGMQVIFSPIWGRLSDRYGRRPILLCSIGGNAIALLVAALATNYWVFLFARFLAGICTSNIPVASAYIVDITPEDQRARGMGLIGAARGIGFVIGPVVGGELSRFGMDVPFFFASALAVVNFGGAWWFLPETEKPSAATQRKHMSFAEQWAFVRQGGVASLLIKIGVAQLVAFSMLEMSYVLFLERRLNLTAAETGMYAGRVFTFIGLILAVVQGGLIGRLAKAYGERVLVVSGVFLVALGMLLLPLTPSGGWGMLLLFTGIVSVGQALVSPSISSLISYETADTNQGVVMGIYHSALAFARVIGPPVAGWLFDIGNENTPYWVGGTLMALTCAVALVGLRPRLKEAT